MNHFATYPYVFPTLSRSNSINSASETLFPQFLNTVPTIDATYLGSFGLNPLYLNSVLYQSYPDLALIKQQQLEALLQAKQQILLNQVQTIRILEQTSNEGTKKRGAEDNLLMNSSNKDLSRVEKEPSACSTVASYADCDQIISEKRGKNSRETSKTLRNQVEELVNFFIKEFGKVENKIIRIQRETYTYSGVLLHVFDSLSSRYISSAKCREDMIRFTLRKAISYLRNCERNQRGLSCKAASLALCKRYFEIDSEDLAQNINIENEEELLNFLLPYKKGSRNRTANSSFMTEIFSSEAFRVDYGEFLDKFDEILQQENKIKLKKFVDHIIKCIKEDKINCLQKFKRLPWLESWLGSTKLIAEELKNTHSSKETRKKFKV